jgi:hypothetical protein
MLKLQNEHDFSFAQKIFEASSSFGYLIANSAEINKKLRIHPQYGAVCFVH